MLRGCLAVFTRNLQITELRAIAREKFPLEITTRDTPPRYIPLAHMRPGTTGTILCRVHSMVVWSDTEHVQLINVLNVRSEMTTLHAWDGSNPTSPSLFADCRAIVSPHFGQVLDARHPRCEICFKACGLTCQVLFMCACGTFLRL